MEKVSQYIIENELLQNGDKVLVALSGGPDSVCLLHILYMLREKFDFKLGAVHINHLLRGDEALKDEVYTKELCNRLNIEYFCERIDINTISSEQGISLELAGRKERYKAFDHIKDKYGYTKVAVAHNANDQAETLLMRLMRGTGLEGLTGIKAKRDDGVIRPILCLNREEIENYCELHSLAPRIDESNYEKIYNRNKVRLDIIPYMKENFNSEIIDTLNRTVSLIQKDNEFIQEKVNEAFDKYCFFEGENLIISKLLFSNEKEAIVTRVVKESIKKVSNSYENFEMKHIYEILELVKKTTGKQIHLTNNIIAENSYDKVLLKRKVEKNEKKFNEEISLVKDSIPTEVEFLGQLIKFEVIDTKKTIEFSNYDLIKYFDYDKIEERILIRTRKNGDKIVPLGMKGSKKLKDIFIDLKIPRIDRDIIPILCFDEKISWIVGYKVSDEFKVTKKTKKILKISLGERNK